MIRNCLPVILVILFSLQTAIADEPAKTGPKAVVPVSEYEFPPIFEGRKVSHDFVIQNHGDEPLVIIKVRTDCKCTMATNVYQIEPGSEEKITVMVDTTGYGGRKLTQTVSVDTNEAGNPVLPLTITGQVEAFVMLQPRRAILKGLYTDPLAAVVRIRSSAEYPFKVLEHHANTGENIRYTLKEIENPKRSEYLLTVENTQKSQGRYFDIITFKTDSPTNPEFVVKIMGILYDPDNLPLIVEPD